MPRPRTGESKPERVMSLSSVATLLGVAPNTVRGWVRLGCDGIVSRPEGKGTDYRLDLAAIVEWRLAREVEKALEKAGRARGDPDDDSVEAMLRDPEKRLKIAREQARFNKEMELVAAVADSEAKWERAFGVIRQSVMALPDRVVRLYPGLDPKVERENYRKIAAFCADAMEEGATEIGNGAADA